MKQKITFSVLSFVFLLYPLFSITKHHSYFLFFIFIMGFSLFSFFRLNLLFAGEKIGTCILNWLLLNIVFNGLFFLSYWFSIYLRTAIHGWYSDMAGFELFIIMPILLFFSFVNLIAVLVKRKQIEKKASQKKWLLALLFFSVFLAIILFISRGMIL